MWSQFKLRLTEKIIIYFFEKEYRYFQYPFETIDYLVDKLPEDEKLQYLEDVRRWYNSKAYQMEETEMKKLFYKELSLSTVNEVSRSGYRLCLLYIRKIGRRYKYLGDKLVLDKHTKTFNRK